MTTESLKRTNLYQWHVDHGGRMVPFAGFEMPVQYPTGPTEEHNATRNAAGLFDIDHMGQIEIRGADAEAFVNHMVTYDVSKMKMNDAHYGLFCYPDGGAVDDLFIYKLPDTKTPGSKGYYFFIAINAANCAKDIAWVKAHLAGYNVQFRDLSEETYMLAFQGPKAPAIINRLVKSDIDQMPRFTGLEETLFGIPVLLGRTGYTGEDGFEIYFPAEKAVVIWEGLLKEGEKDGVKAIGLAARDSLRFEACMPLYGQELSPTLSPVNARLGFAISYDKEFIGRDALLKQKLEGADPLLIGFQMVENAVPRHGYAIAVNGQVVGEVTSGMAAPTVGGFLGMGFIKSEFSKVGTEIDIIIRDKPKKARIVKRPFYTPTYRK